MYSRRYHSPKSNRVLMRVTGRGRRYCYPRQAFFGVARSPGSCQGHALRVLARARSPDRSESPHWTWKWRCGGAPPAGLRQKSCCIYSGRNSILYVQIMCISGRVMQRGVERFSRSKDAEGDMHKFAHHSANNNFRCFSVRGEPSLERTAPFSFVDGYHSGHVK